MLLRQEQTKSIKGISISRNGPSLSHLLFTDDLILFGSANSNTASVFERTLTTYCQWSGQKINNSKSSIQFSNNSRQATKSAIRHILQFKTSSSKIKYLGVPLNSGSPMKSHLNDILVKIQDKLAGWKSKLLSQAGRTTLIRTVASTIPSYTMATTLLPVNMAKKFDRSLMRFWWGFDIHQQHKYTPKAWSSICKPKSLGGLGIRLTSQFNKALMGKLVWHLISNDSSIWKTAILNKYMSTSDWVNVKAKYSDSRFWKCIVKLNDFILSSVSIQINNGTATRVWSDPWLPSLHPPIPSPQIPGTYHYPDLRVAELTLENPRRWNMLLLNTLFSSKTIAAIQRIRLSQYQFHNIHDQPKWKHHSSGKYSVKSAYAAFILHTNTTEPDIIWKKLWAVKLQDRLKLFLWKVYNDILPTQLSLSHCLPIADNQIYCSLCHMENESLDHLFLNCIYSRVLWRNAPWPLDITCFAQAGIRNWINIILNPSDKLQISVSEVHNFQLFSTLAMDTLWFIRNQTIHNVANHTIHYFITKTMELYKEHAKAWEMKSTETHHNWRPPESEDTFSITFDVAVRNNSSTSLAVCRNHQGIFQFIVAQNNRYVDPNLGEATAAFIGVQEAYTRQIAKIVLQGDSLNTIRSINNPHQAINWETEGVARDTRFLLQDFQEWKAVKIHRSQNRCAHSIAQWAHSNLEFGNIPLI
ncbi:hypothetical protein F2P56_013300, partial [Juglans regia]